MRAVGYRQAGAVERENALLDLDLPEPIVSGRNLLIEVRGVSVNPLDTWMRR